MFNRTAASLLFLLAGQSVHAQSTSAPESVSALGRLEPHRGILRVASPSTPYATYGAVLTELQVAEGDSVERGQLLAITDTAALMDAMLEEAKASLDQAEMGVEASRSAARAACVRADVAKREAERRSRLHSQGLAGEEEADSARGEAEAQSASCASASTAVGLSETAVRVAEAHRARIEAERSRSYIHAPVSGRVIEILVWPGEIISDRGVLELGQVDQMYAIAEVYETDVRFISEGQRATVKSPAFDGDIGGTVERIRQKVQKQDEIGTDPAARKDARIVEVAIRLDDSSAVAGLSNLQVDIQIHP